MAGFAEYGHYDGLGLGELVRKRQISAAEVMEEAIRRAEAVNPKLNALTHKAYDVGRKIAEGPLPEGPFMGVPFLYKDLAVQWTGLPTVNACAFLKDLPPAAADMEHVKRIKRAGFVVFGRTNAPENGWCLATEPKLFGPTRNPWDLRRTPGGSSGGSSAAVAARVVPLADASDGGGSIRIPAAVTGLVGLKPARGRISLAPGLVDYWHGGATFLCVSRTVRDTAAYLDGVGGGAPGEPYLPPPLARPYLEEANRHPGRLRIGFTDRSPKQGASVHAECRQAVRETAALLEDLGHNVSEHRWSLDFEPLWRTYTNMTSVQTASGFGFYETLVGRPVTAADVEPVTWAIIARGRSLNAVQHAQDIEHLRIAARAIATELAQFDVFLTPTMPNPPYELGHWDMSIADIDRYNAIMGPDTAFCAPFNVSGLPAMSLPLHWTADNLPVGVQLVGRDHDEATLVRLAGQLEKARPWHHRRPPLAAD
ncbi:MAG: amidase [Alphaproteobacteria bacterium]|nr:amidase [Alphaproteobacteria bacterium]